MTPKSQNLFATLLFAAIASLVGADLLADAGTGAEPLHVGSEAVAAGIGLLGVGVFLGRYRAERAEAARWRAQAQELLAGVGSTVETQFEAWSLTPAEREVAMLLLKGLSFKEISAVRETSERTCREQARGVYRKAGVAGRAELSAWFIEDLLPPTEAS